MHKMEQEKPEWVHDDKLYGAVLHPTNYNWTILTSVIVHFLVTFVQSAFSCFLFH